MTVALNLSGVRFGRLVAKLRTQPTRQGKPNWRCICDCGKTHTASTSNLRQGSVRSCGCLQAESGRAHAPLAAAAITKHGMSKTRLARIFKGMVQRCTNKKVTAYKDYGGRGIMICEEWMADRGRFFSWAIANGYRENLSIDRIDNSLGYSPKNCRWADRKAQSNNTRKNKVLEFRGLAMTLTEWAEHAGIPTKTLWYRLSAGWGLEKAINTPTRQRGRTK